MEDNGVKKRRRWWLAGLLSFLVPGLGQVYNGQERKGLLYYVALSVWGGIFMSAFYYLIKPPVTSGHIALLCLMALVSVVFWFFILFEAIRSARKVSQDYILKRYNRWYIYILIIVVIRLVDLSVETVIVRNTIFRAFKVPAGSMLPTFLVGDHFICDLSYYRTHNPARGDIVLFKWPVNEDIFFIKRIIGIPGDTVRIISDDLYVNNKKLELNFLEKYDIGDDKEAGIYKETLGGSSYRILEQTEKHENFGPVTVPDGKYFVLGDNRDNSSDSRHWGMVRRDQIYGRPVFIYFSWDMKIPAWNIWGRLASIRFSRIGDILE